MSGAPPYALRTSAWRRLRHAAHGVAHVFGIDTQPIADGSYLVIDGPAGPAAAGGWSARRTLNGGGLPGGVTVPFARMRRVIEPPGVEEKDSGAPAVVTFTLDVRGTLPARPARH